MPRGNKRRTDGRVDVTVYIGLDENGRRRYKHFYGATHKEAEAKADEFRIKIGAASMSMRSATRSACG